MSKNDPYRAALVGLAEHLQTTTSFASAFDLFELGLGSDPRFIDACTPTTSALLDRCLGHLAETLVGRGTRWKWLTPLLRYTPGRFLHGAALVGGRPTVVFYFEEHDLGLACVAGSKAHFARLSKVTLPPGATPARGGQA